MATKFVSSQFIKNLVQKSGKTIAVEYVDKTNAWIRPEGFPSAVVKLDFSQVVEDNVATLDPETTRVAMKESEHQSELDKRRHYTAYELDKDGKVIGVKHFIKTVMGLGASEELG